MKRRKFKFDVCSTKSSKRFDLLRGTLMRMISAAHVILYSRDADADRAFFAEVLELPAVDAGGGWLIFRLPPSELAVHPTEGPETHELYLLCEDVDATVAELTGKGVVFTKPVTRQRWGRVTALRLPGGGEVGLYQPLHPVAAGS